MGKARYIRKKGPDGRMGVEHRQVAEAVLGKPLPPRAVIHHVNDDGRDNRRANIVICQDQAYHRMLHTRRLAVRAGHPVHFRRCHYCREFDDPAVMYLNNGNAYHRGCRNQHLRAT